MQLNFWDLGWFWVFVGPSLTYTWNVTQNFECNKFFKVFGQFWVFVGSFPSSNMVCNQAFGFWGVWTRFGCLIGVSLSHTWNHTHTLNAPKCWFWMVLGGYGVCRIPLLTHIWNALLTFLGSFGCLLSSLTHT